LSEDQDISVANSESELKVGQILDGRFEILALISKGPYSSVFKAIQKTVDRTVAIKILNQKLAEANHLARFQHEIQALSSLKHDNIVAAYGVGNCNSVPYIVMEYVEGKSLDKILAERGPLPPHEATITFCQISDALEYAHQKGFIHRDVKPGNIIVESGTGVAKLLDFGLARSLIHDSEVQKLTKTGSFAGTVAYMSPELCANKTVDKRTDLYSMGCLIYEVLTGRQIFTGDSQYEIVYKHLNECPSLVDIDKHYALVLKAALNKEPDKRIASAAQLKAAILDKNFKPEHSNGTGYVHSKIAILLVCLVALFGFLSLAIYSRNTIQKTAEKSISKSIRDGHWQVQLSLLEKEGSKHGYSAAMIPKIRKALSEATLEHNVQGTINANLLLLEALTETKKYDECRAVIKTLQDLVRTCDIKENRRRVFDHSATAYFSAKDYHNAIAQLKLLESEDQDTANQSLDMVRLGDCYLELNDLDTAIKYFKEAIKGISKISSTEGMELTEDLARARIGLAKCYLRKIDYGAKPDQQGNLENARSLLRQVCQIDHETHTERLLIQLAKDELSKCEPNK
jgi:serine/threonine-protein kinase